MSLPEEGVAILASVTALVVLVVLRFLVKEFHRNDGFRTSVIKVLDKLCCGYCTTRRLGDEAPGLSLPTVMGKSVHARPNPYYDRQPSQSASQLKSLAQAALDSATPGAYEHIEGFMEKTDGAGWSWQKRWFVLYNDRLRYYADRRARAPQGEFLLSGATIAFYAHPQSATQDVFQLVTDVQVEGGSAAGSSAAGTVSARSAGDEQRARRATHFCTRGGAAMQQQWIRSICNNMGASAEPGVVEAESTTLVRQGKGRNRKAVLDAGAPDPVGQPAVPQVPLENMQNPLHTGASSSSSGSGGGAEEPGGNNARKGSMSDFLKFHFGNGKR